MYKPVEFRDGAKIENSVNKSILWSRSAVDTKPNSVVAQETLGMIYREVGDLTLGSEIWAIRAFTDAVRLEPTNPVLITELGKANLKANLISEAVLLFEEALELKGNYAPAKFNLAKAYARQEKNIEALILLNELTFQFDDPDIYYEQGRLYYNLGEIEKSVESFAKVIKIKPNHSNALYSIGLALELSGQYEAAQKYFAKVLELNPDNEEVKKKVR